VNGKRLTVVGILPAGFTDDYSSSFVPRSRLWVSGLDLEPEFREFHQFHAIARLKAGVSLRQAQALPGVQAASVSRGVPMDDWAAGISSLRTVPILRQARFRTRIILS
jgi:hypothetical protein